MKVLLDFERLKYPFTGLGQVCVNLGKGLLAIPSSHRFVFYMPSECKDFFANSSRFDEQVDISSLSRIKFIGQFLQSKICREHKVDLWHCTQQEPVEVPMVQGVPYVLTIHDLNCLSQKKGLRRWFRFNRLKRLIEGASAITYISNYVKEDVARHFRLPSQLPQFTIYNGVPYLNSSIENMPNHLPSGLQKKQFFFAIGALLPKKNFLVLMDLMVEMPQMNLVIAGAGSNDYRQELLVKIERLNLSDRVHLVGSITDQERVWYYKNMVALLHPSLLEGFGLPVVESFSFGKPVFCSRLTSLPEVGGDLAFYFDGFEPKKMKAVIVDGLEKIERQSDFSDQAKAWARRFSWANSAKQYIQAYEAAFEYEQNKRAGRK